MNKRFFALDGVRGYAAFAVLVYHAILVYRPSLTQNVLRPPIYTLQTTYDQLVKIGLVVFNGQFAVFIFFTLSGLVLSMALHKSVLRNHMILSLEFTLRRIVRIYPTLIVSLVLFWASHVLLHQFSPELFSKFSLRDLLNNILLISAPINGATWTLQAEILAIPFILFCFFVEKKSGVKGLLVVLAYSILSFFYPFLRIPFIPVVLLENLTPFVCGFLIYTKEAERFFTTIGKRWPVLALAALGIFLVPQIVRFSSPLSTITQWFSMSILLGMIYYRSFNRLVDLLEGRFPVYLGKISYSFYLNNVIFLYIFHPIVRNYFPTASYPLEFGILTTILCLLPTLVLSHITEKYVEQPSIQFGKSITAWCSLVERKFFPVAEIKLGTSEDVSEMRIEEN